MRSSFRVIDHEGRHFIEEFPKNVLGLFRQRSFPKSKVHQADPSFAGSLIYMKRRMTRPQAWMASLFNVSVRPPNLPIRKSRRRCSAQKGGDQARETLPIAILRWCRN
jgi:hypothetical protein